MTAVDSAGVALAAFDTERLVQRDLIAGSLSIVATLSCILARISRGVLAETKPPVPR